MKEKLGETTRVLYVSAYTERAAYKRLFHDAPFPPSQAAQNYHRIMTSGLTRAGADVHCVTVPPVSRQTSRKRVVFLKDSTSNGVSFHYLPIVDLPALKHLIVAAAAFFYTLSHLGKDSFVLCDGLCLAATTGARLAAKLMRRPCAAIVTDLPEMLGGRTAPLVTRSLARFDGFVLLTEAMDQRINPRQRPFIVVEGQADEDMCARTIDPANKRPEKVVFYAGMLHAIYGVTRLTEAFMLLDDPNARLRLYGAGDAVAMIQASAVRDDRISYLGVADHETIVDEELRATLLVNPRPSDAEYTKYSFPSKNMEYMASGTPLLTTRLPGMPKEYDEFVYLFDGETPRDMANALQKTLALPAETLAEKGWRARAFVLENKSSKVQGARILALLRGLDSQKG